MKSIIYARKAPVKREGATNEESIMTTLVKKDPNALTIGRVSYTEQQETGYSLEAQVKANEDYGRRNNFDIAKVYKITESASGKQVRKTFNEMLQYATKNKIDIIICEKIDRLTRNMKDAVMVSDWINADEKREIHFVRENFIVNKNTKAHENFIWDMKVAVARFYTNNLSEEVRKGQKEKLSQGWLPSRAKLGYKTEGEKGHKIHVIDSETAPLIQKMFELYSTGNYSIKALVDIMNKAGLRNENGRKIGKSRIHEILSDHFYYGQIVWLGQIHEGKQEPIITRGVFDLVQQRLSRKIKNPQYKKHLPMFKAKIECEECGGTITWETQKGHWYGHCNHYKACSQKGFIRQEEIEKQLIQHFEKIAPKTKRALEWLEKALKENHSAEIKVNTSKRNNLTRIVTTADKRIENAYRDKLDNKMPLALCEKIIEESSKEKRDAIEDLGKLTESRQAYYEAGYTIHELALNAVTIFTSPKATVDDKRMLLSYAFSNLCLNTQVMSINYTPAFEFLKKWMPIVNRNFEPRKNAMNKRQNDTSMSSCPDWLHTLNEIRTHFRQTPDE